MEINLTIRGEEKCRAFVEEHALIGYDAARSDLEEQFLADEKAVLFADELEACEGAAKLHAVVRSDGVCHVGRDDGRDGNGVLRHGPVRLPRLADEIEQQHANLVSGKQPVGALAVWHGHAAAVAVGVGADEKIGAQTLAVGKAERHRLANFGVGTEY